VWHDLLICGIQTCDMTYWYVAYKRVTWLIDMWPSTNWYGKSINHITCMNESYENWKSHWFSIFICNMPHSHVTWLIHLWHHVANKAQALPWGPMEDFGHMIFKKTSSLGSISWLYHVPWCRRSTAQERLMTDLAWCMLWSTGSVTGVYEHRRTTRLIYLRHRSFRGRAALLLSDIISKKYESQGRKCASDQNPPWGLQESLSIRNARDLWICDMTYWYTAWLIHTFDKTHWLVRSSGTRMYCASHWFFSFSYVTCLIHIRHDSLCVTCLIHTWHDSSICDMTDSYVWHDTCDKSMRHVT